ncbi:MAG: branched-chain amino acid aminotransferase [Acidobacteria bacterium]|nr:MAG: branched-chain amino acid aminotransferase [Acidobacteriota bacterium]
MAVTASNESIVYLNGRFVPASEAKVSVFDHSFLYGDGCFETIIVRNGKPFRLLEHIDRLVRTTRVLGIRIPLSPDDLHNVLLEMVKRNSLTNAYARITLTRGEGYSSSDPRLCEKPTLVMFAYDLENHPAEKYGGKGPGLRCMIVSTRRIPPVCLDARIKANNYINMILARMEAIAASVDEAIMLDINNFISECPSRNIFTVRNNELETPNDHNVLNGITRDVIIELAHKNGWPVRKRDLTAYDLYNSDEVLACSTGGGIKPIVEVDGREISDGQVGPVTRKLMQQYEEMLVS